MIEQSKGIVDVMMMKEAIAEKYEVDLKSIKTKTEPRNGFATFTFKKQEGGPYGKVTECILTKDETSDVMREILHKDGISFHSTKAKFEYIPGDVYEPMDYGSYKLLGFEFTYQD